MVIEHDGVIVVGQSNLAFWCTQALIQELYSEKGLMRAAYVNRSICRMLIKPDIGVAMIHHNKWLGCRSVSVYVKPNARKRGHGRTLLKRLLEEIEPFERKGLRYHGSAEYRRTQFYNKFFEAHPGLLES